MPFAIVEANDEESGSNELFVVPEGWLLDTEQTNTILLWPKCEGPKMYKLLTDGESVANTKWMKMNCTVKRINISSLSVAYEHVSKIKGELVETSREAAAVVQTSPSPTPMEEVCSNVPSEDEATKEKESSFSKTLPTGKEIVPPSEIVRTITEKDFYNFLKKVDQKIILLETIVRKITAKVLFLETKAQDLFQQLGCPLASKAQIVKDIDFKQIDKLESLETFNEKLLDKAYQDEIYDWLDSQITEVKSENRMTEAIDLLFTKQFMTKCSWTGVGRGSEKIAMMRMVNVCKLFRRIGTNESTVVNQRMVMMFFMKKLRNAVRRSEMKHLRRSTAHNVPSHKVKPERQ